MSDPHGPQLFGVVPAAGRSRRMGRAKLLLPFRGRPLIDHLLAAWIDGGLQHVVVVVRRDDLRLAEACRQRGVRVVCPAVDPPDMKASVQHALRQIRQDWSPRDEDYWLLAPADMPLLSSGEMQTIVAACKTADGRIVIPVHDGRRGHPTGFPWPLAEEALRLPPDAGLNALVARHEVLEAPIESAGVLTDIDTPEDYRTLDGEES